MSSTPLPPVKVHHPHVDVRAEVLDGSPVVAGSRVAVRTLWAWQRKGVSIATLVKRYPSLGWNRILAALAFAYDNEDLIEVDLARERASCQPARDPRQIDLFPAPATTRG